ncbi:MAG: hypothetical protein ACFFA6_00015 [Promethearchaeota archaeon]
MKLIEKYLHICRKFHNLILPKLKFKELSERYKRIYNEIYDISENDIYKANFAIFFISFGFSIISLFVFSSFHLLIIIFYSFLFSLILSYKFSVYLLNEIRKEESVINAMLYIIKIDFSLIQKSLNNKSDYCVSFIELIKNYNLPISDNFKKILKKIHEGEIPEKALIKIITPSEDFNNYLNELLTNNFNNEYTFEDFNENTLEKKFKIYLREVESKLSIIFFIGLFFPIGLCFLLLFQLVNQILILFLIAIFLFILNLLFKKFLKQNNFLIGLLGEYSNLDKKRFHEFILFLKSFANNLARNISPEYAFFKSYIQNRNLYNIIKEPLKNQISLLLNISCSFQEMIKNLKFELNSIRFRIILDAIEKFIKQNAYYSSEKIFEILTILSKHQKLEKKLEIIIKGEKFKVFFFLFLLPIITGVIGGMLPFFILLTKNIELTNNFTFNLFFNSKYFKDIIIIFLTLLSTISITSYYFLRIINQIKQFFIILIVNVVYFLTFSISFLNVLNFV